MTLNRFGLPPFVPAGVRILVAGVLLSTIGPTESSVGAAQDSAGEIAPPPLQEGEPDAAETPPDAPAAEPALAGTLKALTDRLERDFPDREAIVRGGDALPRALLELRLGSLCLAKGCDKISTALTIYVAISDDEPRFGVCADVSAPGGDALLLVILLGFAFGLI